MNSYNQEVANNLSLSNWRHWSLLCSLSFTNTSSGQIKSSTLCSSSKTRIKSVKIFLSILRAKKMSKSSTESKLQYRLPTSRNKSPKLLVWTEDRPNSRKRISCTVIYKRRSSSIFRTRKTSQILMMIHFQHSIKKLRIINLNKEGLW